MSNADELVQAANTLLARAQAATPGPWSAADEHGLMPGAWPAWCVSQMRPGYEQMSETEGYVNDIADVHGDDKDANPNAEYIALMNPLLGVMVADRLAFMAGTHVGDGPDGCEDCARWLPLARLINGGAA